MGLKPKTTLEEALEALRVKAVASGDEVLVGLVWDAIEASGQTYVEQGGTDLEHLVSEIFVAGAQSWDSRETPSTSGERIRGFAAILAAERERQESTVRETNVILRAGVAWKDRAKRAENEVKALREALVLIANQRGREIMPWTHEAAADEFSRMLDVDRNIACAALQREKDEAGVKPICASCVHPRHTTELLARAENAEGEAKAWESTAISRQNEAKALREALTPSEMTKAAYIGEFEFSIRDLGDDGNETHRAITIPWVSIKEIMAAILTRAALQGQGGAGL
jgi:hypothetical protein